MTIKNTILIIITFLVIGILSIRMVKGFIPLPIGIRHLFHRIISPEDLHQPIVTDNFLFFENNFSKTYSLHPKYLDIYEIGFFNDEAGISSKYKFRGKIKAEFFWKDKLLFDKIATTIDSAWYVQGDVACYKSICLLKFCLPLQGKYKKDISVRLTVLEPDEELEKYKNSLKLYIAVSAVP